MPGFVPALDDLGGKPLVGLRRGTMPPAPKGGRGKARDLERSLRSLLDGIPVRARLSLLRKVVPTYLPNPRPVDEWHPEIDALDALDADDDIAEATAEWSQADQEDLRDNVARYVSKSIERWKREGKKVTKMAVRMLIDLILREIRRGPKRWREKNCKHH